MTAHNHAERVEGCYRCNLRREEAEFWANVPDDAWPGPDLKSQVEPYVIHGKVVGVGPVDGGNGMTTSGSRRVGYAHESGCA